MATTASAKPVSKNGSPFRMTNPLRVPRERYYSREFYEEEKQQMWFRSWLMACRLQEIPEPNDFVEFEICDQSILVIRQPDLSVRAFHNTCRHRATQLAKGSGNLADGQIVCPFHGWRWNTDGSTSFLYGAKGFAPECMQPDDIRLRECKAEIWGGCAWINLDPDAEPLMETLQPAAKLLDDIGIENLSVRYWKEAVLNCNWKIALEAFLEGWHVMQTHPQNTMEFGDKYSPDSATYTTYENGHSSFDTKSIREIPSLDLLIRQQRTLFEGQEAMVLERELHIIESLKNTLGPGDSVRDAVATAIRDHYHGAGIPMAKGIENGPFWWAGEVFLFPHFVILPMYANALSYRVRPHNDDPEWCRFEIWSLTTLPASQPVERARLEGRYDKEDEENWGLIPRQDFGNMERQQMGLHSTSYEAHRLATEWENAITNLHEEIDRRLAAS